MGTTFATLHVMNLAIKNILLGKIFGLVIDNNLDFNDRIPDMCKTANQKLNALLYELRQK